ncbi:hypothetical protein N9F34_00040 [Alphaproteobacteria bacterium]|nr:hypothetical protein [Alphaproteobacteria bacterium]
MILDIRAATVDDASTVYQVAKNLAASQELASGIRTTIEDISRDGFGAHALHHVILAE